MLLLFNSLFVFDLFSISVAIICIIYLYIYIYFLYKILYILYIIFIGVFVYLLFCLFIFLINENELVTVVFYIQRESFLKPNKHLLQCRWSRKCNSMT